MACLLPLLALSVSGCGNADAFGCTADVRSGIVVEVYDSQTRAPIATGAVGTLQDGSYTETLMPFGYDIMGNLIGLGGAQERTGTYTVRIEKAGYAPWEMKNVRVTKNACHVNTTGLEADLQPVK